MGYFPRRWNRPDCNRNVARARLRDNAHSVQSLSRQRFRHTCGRRVPVAVPAGAVAIAGRQTGVYPRQSPGGWHLLGRTPLTIADPEAGHFPVRPGDRLRFDPIDAEEFRRRRGEPLA